MMELLEDVFIRCSRCGKVTGIHKEDFDFESYVYDRGDNRMGEEIEFRHEGYIKCDQCDNEISFRISGYEYPIGAFNYEDSEITGGRFEEEPHMGVIYSQDDFDLDDAYPAFTRVEQIIMDIAQNRELIYDISPREFEAVIERVLQDEGFETKLTQQTRDGGRDIIATKYEMGKPVVFYIECKRYGRQNSVGVNIVRSLYGVQSADQINKAILVTTGHVTRGARRFVDDQNTMMSVIDVEEMDKYYRDLLTVKAVSTKYVKARNEYLTPHTVREIHKVLRNAFNQAVKWELMTRNPVEHATLPKEEHKTRDIWTAEVLLKALEACDDDILRLAINLAFSCSLRMGELLGLTWDCVDISPASIELGQASIFVEKELQRVNREAMADLNGKDIMFKFPPTFASTHTALVLKTPKTKTSVRKVFLPKTVAEMLVQRKADIEELKDLFGDEFVDFNLVFCSSNGKPIEGQVINRAFNKLIEENGLPKVVFHSLRHSSITYKLKLNGGDMKSVQGDSGHAQVKMVADVYSHIIDDDRRLNAERLEAAFYSGRQATPEPVQPVTQESSTDDKELLLKLLQNPEMAALLKSLAKTL